MERRVFGSLYAVQTRAEDGETAPMIVEGYIAEYNKPTIYGGRKEVVRPGAFDKALRTLAEGKSKIIALYHHGAVPRVYLAARSMTRSNCVQMKRDCGRGSNSPIRNLQETSLQR